MAKGSYQVIFSGEIIEHADIDMVKNNVARVFSLPSDRIDKLFSGKRLVLKKDIDQATAERYKTTLQRAGALCEVEDLAAVTTEETKPDPVPVTQAEAPADSPGMSVAEPGSQIGEHQEIPEANIDTSAFDMAEVGISLAESSQVVADVNIDTSNINMSEVGITLAEPKEVVEADIDVTNIDMAEAGVTLKEPEEFLEAEFDLADLTMDEVGTTLVESKPIPEANIDTSDLSLD